MIKDKSILRVVGKDKDILLAYSKKIEQLEKKSYIVVEEDLKNANKPDAILLPLKLTATDGVQPNPLENKIKEILSSYPNTLVIIVPCNEGRADSDFKDNITFLATYLPQVAKGIKVVSINTQNAIDAVHLTDAMLSNVDQLVRDKYAAQHKSLVSALELFKTELEKVVLPWAKKDEGDKKISSRDALLQAIHAETKKIIDQIETELKKQSISLEDYKQIIADYRQVERSYLLSDKGKDLLAPSVSSVMTKYVLSLFQPASVAQVDTPESVAAKMDAAIGKMEKMTGIWEQKDRKEFRSNLRGGKQY